MLKPFYQEGLIEAGIDEAGRGSLIGRVYAGVVIWDPNIIEPKGFELKDSKKISKKKRVKERGEEKCCVSVQDHEFCIHLIQ